VSLRIGVLGGGQLGRMLALAGMPLGLEFVFFDSIADATSRQCGELVVKDFLDFKALEEFASSVDIVTYEFENVPVEAVDFILKHAQVYPPRAALELSQDRLFEKKLFTELGIATPKYLAINSEDDLTKAVAEGELPLVLKSRRLGYDGKGQFVLERSEQISEAWEAIGKVPAIAEAFVPFSRELSLIGVRGHDGSTSFYPLVENHHFEGILRLTLAPAGNISVEIQRQAEHYLQSLLDRMSYVGVLTLELFQVGTTLLANEMAPRVHNSGHWTIEAAETSQFENHLRALLGYSLGSTNSSTPSAMINLIGELPDPESVLKNPGTHFHTYRKQPKAGRKVGHVTISGHSASQVAERIVALLHLLPRKIAEQVTLN